jgi:hypothetical protein
VRSCPPGSHSSSLNAPPRGIVGHSKIMTTPPLSLAVSALGFLLPTVAGAAPEKRNEERATTLRIRRLDLHDAARFVGHVFGANVMVIAEVKPCTLEIQAASADPALGALARSAGLATRTVHGVSVIASEPVLSNLQSAPPLTGGRSVDLDFKQASLKNIASILADVGKLKLDGDLAGQASIVVRNRPALDVLRLVLGLGGRVISHGQSGWRVAPREGLPRPNALPAPCPPSPHTAVALSCVPVEQLAVGAVAMRGKRAWASLVRDQAGPGASRGHTVRVGHFAGTSLGDASPRRVLRIDAKGVTLEGDIVMGWPSASRPR